MLGSLMRASRGLIIPALLLAAVAAAGCTSPARASSDAALSEDAAVDAGAAAGAVAVINAAMELDAEGEVGAALDLLTGWEGPPEARSRCLEAAAVISLKHAQPSMAVLSLEKAIEARPDVPSLYMQKGAALMAAGRESAAEVALRECLALDWSQDRAKILMAELLFQAGRIESAAAYVDALGADFEPVESAAAYVDALGADFEPVESAAAYVDALGADFEPDARSLIVMGAIRHRSGRTEEALKLFARAALADASLAEPYFNRGCVFEQSGGLDLAEKAYEEALRRNPEHVPSLFNLGRLFVDTDRGGEGRRLIEAACVLEKDPVLKKSMLKTSSRLLLEQ